MRKFTHTANVVSAITFKELVKIGVDSGAKVKDGMPLSFQLHDKTITYQDKDIYIMPGEGGNVIFRKGEMLLIDPNGRFANLDMTLFTSNYCPATLKQAT